MSRALLLLVLAVAGVGCGTACDYDERVFRPGETFDARDGCNTCTCQWNGDVVCTRLACRDDTAGDTDTDTDLDT